MDETMNCQETEQLVLDAFETPLSATEREGLDEHCSHCLACAEFAAAQSELDQRLRRFITAPALNTEFRNHLMNSIRERPLATIPTWSPDVAYSVGTVVALIVSSIVLPFRHETVLTIGVLICVAAYLLQSFIFVFVNEPCD